MIDLHLLAEACEGFGMETFLSGVNIAIKTPDGGMLFWDGIEEDGRVAFLFIETMEKRGGIGGFGMGGTVELRSAYYDEPDGNPRCQFQGLGDSWGHEWITRDAPTKTAAVAECFIALHKAGMAPGEKG